MTTDNTKIIDLYLSGDLSTADQLAFEAQIKADPALAREVAQQKDVIEGVKRAHQRQQIKKIKRNYLLNRLLKITSLSVLSLALITTATVLATKDDSPQKNKKPKPVLTKKLQRQLDKRQDFENVPVQYFEIPTKGQVVLSKQGVLISVPEFAFLKNGKPYSGPVVVQFQEAITAFDIMTSGLSTMTGDQRLETQGMFSVAGYDKDGNQLDFNPEVGVYVQTPIDDCLEDMRLYDGKKLANGTIDWVEPVELEKIPVPVDMSDLNFYPEGYEDHLDAQLWNQDKESRDSLYLSLEQSMPREELTASNNAASSPRTNELAFPLNSRLPVPDVLASYPGGRLAMDEFIESSPFYKVSKNGNSTVSGKVMVQFFVNQDGSISNVLSRTKGIEALEEAANKIVATMPNWKPALKNKRKIPSFVRFAMYFGREKDAGYENITSTLTNPRGAVAGGQTEDVEAEENFILPSKVMAFWDPKFNNTNLATREFERRMKAIHGTCNNEVLDVYVNNIDVRMSELDAKIVRMGYPQFKAFMLENVGCLNPNNPHLEGLKAFYEASVDALRADAKRNVDSEKERIREWNKYVDQKREENLQQSVERQSQFMISMTSNFTKQTVQAHLIRTNGFTIRSGSFGSLTARRNCDALRQLDYGLTKVDGVEQINAYRYSIVDVYDAKKYKDIYVYLLPDNLNTYQRIKVEGAGFTLPLMSSAKHSLVVVGVTEDGFEAHFKKHFSPAQLYAVGLKPISDEKLEEKMNTMSASRLKSPVDFSNELDWLSIERSNYNEQKRIEDLLKFRIDLKEVIFPCYVPPSVNE